MSSRGSRVLEELDRAMELARRMIEAFESPIHAFIYQRGIDDVNLVARVVRDAGIGQLVEQVVISGREGIYALLVNERGCRSECGYGRCEPGDEECMARCMDECRAKRLEAIIARLREFIGERG